MSDFWQAPGNGKWFDSPLGSLSKMNIRTIGTLNYIKEREFVDEELLKRELKQYLFDNFKQEINER